MVRKSKGAVFRPQMLDRKSGLPLNEQICRFIRSEIYAGNLRPGVRLPASRVLAGELGVSRTTIRNAYDQLDSEGVIETRTGSGVFVSTEISTDIQRRLGKGGAGGAISVQNPHSPSGQSNLVASTAKSRRIATLSAYRLTRAMHFAPNIPDHDLFPERIWTQLLTRTWRDRKQDQNLPVAGGAPELRRAIASHLRVARGVECDPRQVIVTAGNRNGLSLIARVLFEQGDHVMVEEPSSLTNVAILKANGLQTIPCGVDRQGLIVPGEGGFPTEGRGGRSPVDDRNVRAVYVTPARQYPMGHSMSAARRIALFDWAERRNALIIEDDYDSEFRYQGRPLAPLQAVDRTGRVIYMGTFSKALSQTIRLGYLVVPSAFVEAFERMAYLEGVLSEAVQQTMATFLDGGHLMSHLRFARKIYRARRDLLVDGLRGRYGEHVEITGSESGLHVVAWLPEGTDDSIAFEKGLVEGILIYPLWSFMQDADAARLHYPRPALVLSYTMLNQINADGLLARLFRSVDAAGEAAQNDRMQAYKRLRATDFDDMDFAASMG